MENDKIYVIPNVGIKIPFPDNTTGFLPENGAWVKQDQYWTRRIIEEGCFIGKPQKNITKKIESGSNEVKTSKTSDKNISNK